MLAKLDPLALSFALLALLQFGAPAAAEDMRAPSPKRIIYPGQTIQEDMLVETPLAKSRYDGPVALAPEDAVGMTATRTLLPGLSIPLSALTPPRLVRAGSPVKMIYVDGGLTITATGAALQDGVVGQVVNVRNEDSGVTVSGRVRSDGAIVVSGG
jgi:flagella basal body P-ring formation protein FlgA